MDDREAGAYLLAARHSSDKPGNNLADIWEGVARCARSLFGPTAEERAVIDLAERVRDAWTGRRATHNDRCAGCLDCKLWEAVDALRKARLPKPRYRAETTGRYEELPWMVRDHTDPRAVIGRYENEAQAERIARLLEADSAAK